MGLGKNLGGFTAFEMAAIIDPFSSSLRVAKAAASLHRLSSLLL